MTTLNRLAALLPVLAEFPELGPFAEKEELLDLLVTELGSATALEDGMAEAPRIILHVMSQNTPLAAMQSLIRGLLLGSRNRCKLPSGGLERFEEFVEKLPNPLGELVECSTSLPADWLQEADAVVVFGSDETVQNFRQSIRSDQTFAGYGHRWSGAVIFADPDGLALPLLARDIGLYDQLGCLSAQVVFVHRSVDARRYAEHLSAALQGWEESHPRRKLSQTETLAVESWRQQAQWRSAMTGESAFWGSDGSTAWSVFYDAAGEVALTPLFRSVLVVPFSGQPNPGDLGKSLSTLGISPFTPEYVARCRGMGASRFCKLGEMQFPRPTWQQDGFPALGRLVQKPG